MTEQKNSAVAIVNAWAWLLPLLPLGLAVAIYFGGLQTATFLFVNHYTQLLPDVVWTWLTFLGNGWGIFALCFPLLLLAPRLFVSSLFGAAIGGLISQTLKLLLNLPRPSSVLPLTDFYRVGEPLLHNAMPSGHTLTAFAVASGIYFSADKDKRSSLWWIFVIASCVGLSRNALGAHWLTDVLAGCAIGVWSGMIGALLSSYIPSAQLAPSKIGPRLLSLAGIGITYVLLTQVLDSPLNASLQYACVALIGITLMLLIQAQKNKGI
ncbi:phosphatase PAP2 family protein [Polynucleobacter brandtiae]|uniref:PAP2 superfamily protein n=1 Tax=Polynucleobacter brandtiae TaxID=1938816 RepID=A0A2M8VYV4_9BURK|nr:phosphatase PAP2 family protein [Polynucleobacter brandtiae]PJI83025.1 PAP2 superfamily protein [Polynucleobacter brandtiae]